MAGPKGEPDPRADRPTHDGPYGKKRGILRLARGDHAGSIGDHAGSM